MCDVMHGDEDEPARQTSSRASESRWAGSHRQASSLRQRNMYSDVQCSAFGRHRDLVHLF
jgi:hypothetical protein